MNKKIGFSFSMCLRSIAKGEVAIGDVDFIITGTAYPDRESMLTNMRDVMLGRDVDTHLANAAALWDSGRIYQPAVRQVGRAITSGSIWADSPVCFS